MATSYSILSLLKTLNKNGLLLIEQRELISYCSKIALNILRKRYDNDFNRFPNQGITLQDFAVDSIAPLFIKDKSGELPLRLALLNWDKEI
ncbi:MAG: hypothetical protein ACYC5G_05610, partial [Candidatus Doudnabacteria bacterium]